MRKWRLFCSSFAPFYANVLIWSVIRNAPVYKQHVSATCSWYIVPLWEFVKLFFSKNRQLKKINVPVLIPQCSVCATSKQTLLIFKNRKFCDEKPLIVSFEISSVALHTELQTASAGQKGETVWHEETLSLTLFHKPHKVALQGDWGGFDQLLSRAAACRGNYSVFFLGLCGFALWAMSWTWLLSLFFRFVIQFLSLLFIS